MSELFKFHKLNEQGQSRAAAIAHIFECTLNELSAYMGAASREVSIVKTKLEEACFFAKKAMAMQPENQE